MADSEFEQLVADARRRWAAWIADLAAGRPAPHPIDVLEVAAVLEIRDPGESLERAAARARVGAARNS